MLLALLLKHSAVVIALSPFLRVTSRPVFHHSSLAGCDPSTVKRSMIPNPVTLNTICCQLQRAEYMIRTIYATRHFIPTVFVLFCDSVRFPVTRRQDFGLVSVIPPGVMDALICATVNVMNRYMLMHVSKAAFTVVHWRCKNIDPHAP